MWTRSKSISKQNEGRENEEGNTGGRLFSFKRDNTKDGHSTERRPSIQTTSQVLDLAETLSREQDEQWAVATRRRHSLGQPWPVLAS
jgi:hypothetical protein